MKSAILTLLILIALFAALNGGALDLIGSSTFHYVAFASVFVVFAAAYFIVGFEPQKNEQDNLSDTLPSQEDADDE